LVTARAGKPPRSGLSRSDFVLWPEPEATLAAGGVRCPGSTCRRSVGRNPPLVTQLGHRVCIAAFETLRVERGAIFPHVSPAKLDAWVPSGREGLTHRGGAPLTAVRHAAVMTETIQAREIVDASDGF
jgi:hypothetical protein